MVKPTPRLCPRTALRTAVSALIALSILWGVGPTAGAAQATVGLGTADSFAVLAGSTVTNTGSTLVNGDLGVSPATAVTGFPPGTVNGTIHAGDAAAAQAQSDLTIAYNDAAGRACDVSLTGQDLGGKTLTAGAYCFSSSAQLTGTVTLNAKGDADAVFIFQIGSTLTTASASSVSLINGADACNIFWQIGSSATLGTNTAFRGNILALTSITLVTGATVVNGRALARTGAVKLDTNTLTRATCAPTPTPTPTPTATPTPTPTPTATATATVEPLGVVPPSGGGTTPASEPAVSDVPRTGGAPEEGGFPWLLIVVPACAGLVSLGRSARAPRRFPSRTGGRSQGILATLLLIASLFIAPVTASGSASAEPAGPGLLRPQPMTEPSVLRDPQVAHPVAAPSALFRPGLDLRAPPIEIPLQLRIPSINVVAPMLGVGITSSDAMNAPMGPPDDDIWQKAFWYRGSGTPGDAGTATIAGHVSGGRSGSVFARLGDLRRGNTIVVHDPRSDLDIHFTVTATRIYSLEQLARPSILAAIYGSGPVSGRGPLPSPDGVSHLTLITCAGDRVGSTYGHRLVVYADRTN